MSFLHSHSSECAKSELDLFRLPPTQTSIENGTSVHFKPLASLTDNAPIEFVIPGAGDEYIDLAHTMLAVRIKIKLPTLSEGAAQINVAPVNNTLHSLFSQIDVFLNQKLISPPSQAYAYRAYIETLLNYDTSAKNSHLTTGLWYKDTADKMDSLTENDGFKKRAAFTKDGVEIDLLGHLHCDLFNQDRFLVNGVELRVKLVRSKDTFCLMSDTTGVKISITDATLLVRKVKISPTVLLAHSRALEKATVKYPLTRVDIRNVSIPKDMQSKTLDNLFLGQLPNRVIVGFVSNSAFNGTLTTNPYNFQHFFMNFLSLYVDGKQYPSRPLQPDFDSTKQYVSSYHTLFSGTGIHFQDEGNDISREDYPYGYCLTAFDLTPDLSAHTDVWNVQKQGALRLEVQFSKPLTETINCIIYAELDNLLQVDQKRNVIVDYSS